MADAFDVMMDALDRTEAALERGAFERTLDDWANGQLTLWDAHQKLVQLGHGTLESTDMLQSHDPERFAAQHSYYNGELAGVI